MLSYQHIYHAGALADVHKHALICLILDHLVKKDKPLSYIETHSGRGVYDLSSPEALKTREFQSGIEAVLKNNILPASHPFIQAVLEIRHLLGATLYPGSPALAHYFLRATDKLHLMELHPTEFEHLQTHLSFPNVSLYKHDGYKGALALSPPTPRRGLVFIDPSYEVKKEYGLVSDFIQKLHRKWAEAVIVVWYPILAAGYHRELIEDLSNQAFKNAALYEISFKATKGIQGSGLFIINPPYGLDEALKKTQDALTADFGS